MCSSGTLFTGNPALRYISRARLCHDYRARYIWGTKILQRFFLSHAELAGLASDLAAVFFAVFRFTQIFLGHKL